MLIYKSNVCNICEENENRRVNVELCDANESNRNMIIILQCNDSPMKIKTTKTRRRIIKSEIETNLICELKGDRYIDYKKELEFFRILTMNTNDFRPDNDLKVNNMIIKCQKLKILMALLQETNCR